MPRRSRPVEPSGPRWLTAPGLRAGATVQERPADAEPTPAERTSPVRSWLTEAPPPPRSLGRPAHERPAEPDAAEPTVDDRTADHRTADDLRADELRADELRADELRADELRADARAAAARAATARAAAAAAAPPAASARPRTPEPAPPDEAAESELAAPQVRLDQELPRSRPASSERTAVAGRNGQGAVARYAPERELFSRSIRSLEPISDPEAAAFAGRFAADFQSFDEDDPGNRAQVLRPLLADPQASTWGWSGIGRQRADSPLPGRIFRTSDTVVFVEVIVRATTYARVRPPSAASDRTARVDDEPVGLIGPSSAPPESDPCWVAAGANWLRMTVPVTRSPDDGRLVVDPHLVPDQSV